MYSELVIPLLEIFDKGNTQTERKLCMYSELVIPPLETFAA